MAARTGGTIGLAAATMLGVLLWAAPGSALTTTFTSGTINLAIPDNNAAGVSSVIALPGGTAVGDVLQHLAVQVAIDHTWVGDLTIRLTAPDTTVITLVHQPGIPAADAAANLDRANPILFDDGNATPASQMGNGCGSNQVIGVSCTAAFAPTDGLAYVLGNFSGDWKLRVSDGIADYTGTLASWSLQTTFEPVPEPSAGALVTLGLVGLAARSRSRRSRS